MRTCKNNQVTAVDASLTTFGMQQYSHDRTALCVEAMPAYAVPSSNIRQHQPMLCFTTAACLTAVPFGCGECKVLVLQTFCA